MIWSGGPKGKPPHPPRWTARQAGGHHIGRKPPLGGAQSAPAPRRAGSPQWRRLRQNARALWRWVVIRAVRAVTGRFGARLMGEEPPTIPGEVRRFPNGQ
jgi:predicted alpha/beta hydrolase